eukprot:gnl/TRDRNA2_/TRDRNA2_186694_c0_seq1.p1 gnl/TRDRNA2_/TRDRNA2_186694_c0~~gnl/TRDRNA2_/TRDRNA2_186694_c0_seq1.p1  ORF type:complete len:347 (+),score=48.36 gnl/TRDRNA2_/TRDRNA2_186694_c0_seq1:60-1043(+)
MGFSVAAATEDADEPQTELGCVVCPRPLKHLQTKSIVWDGQVWPLNLNQKLFRDAGIKKEDLQDNDGMFLIASRGAAVPRTVLECSSRSFLAAEVLKDFDVRLAGFEAAMKQKLSTGNMVTYSSGSAASGASAPHLWPTATARKQPLLLLHGGTTKHSAPEDWTSLGMPDGQPSGPGETLEHFQKRIAFAMSAFIIPGIRAHGPLAVISHRCWLSELELLGDVDVRQLRRPYMDDETYAAFVARGVANPDRFVHCPERGLYDDTERGFHDAGIASCRHFMAKSGNMSMGLSSAYAGMWPPGGLNSRGNWQGNDYADWETRVYKLSWW